MEYYVFFEEGGTPKAGLSPSWHKLASTDGTDKSGSGPSISAVSNCDGCYAFDIKLGTAPWDDITEDLVGWIDGGSALVAGDRYKPVSITKRGLALAKFGHDGKQDLATGTVTVMSHDGSVEEFKIKHAGLKLNFDSGGTTAIAAGDTIEGQTSGASGVVAHVVVESGSWAGGNADGFLLLSSTSGTFEDDELLDVSPGTDLATVDGTLITSDLWKYMDKP